jgi:hypothetical protein
MLWAEHRVRDVAGHRSLDRLAVELHERRRVETLAQEPRNRRVLCGRHAKEALGFVVLPKSL